MRVSKDALYHDVAYAEAVRVRGQTSPRRMPAMPLGKTSVTDKLVIRVVVTLLRLLADLAAVKSRQNDAVH